MHWPFLPFLLQFAMGNYTQNWIKHETDCCKNRTFYSSFFVPKFRKDVAQWQTETAPIRCNFISAMMSSTFSLPNSKHPAWKACQPFYARHVLEQTGINLKGLNVDKLKAEYQELMKQKNELTSTYKNCEKEVQSLNRKLENLNQYLGQTQPDPVQAQQTKNRNHSL